MLLHKKVLDWLAFCNSTELKHNLLLLCCEKGLFTAFKNTYTIYPFLVPWLSLRHLVQQEKVLQACSSLLRPEGEDTLCSSGKALAV